MRRKQKTVIELFDKEGLITVSKTFDQFCDDGRPPYTVLRGASIRVFDAELVYLKTVEIDVDEKEVQIDLTVCNNLLALVDLYLTSQLKARVEFNVPGRFELRGETKTKGTKNLLLGNGADEIYLTPFEARVFERTVKNVLTFLVKS